MDNHAVVWILDADVIVAALRSRTGASAEIVRRVLRGELSIGLSVAMVLEYEAVATRPDHVTASGLSVEDILTVIDALAAQVKPVETHFSWRPQLRDPDDEMILEAAVNAQASAIVSFNVKDFGDVPKQFGIEILLPRTALERLR